MIRPAADETTTRESETGVLLAQAAHVIRRRWTGFVCEVKSLQWHFRMRRRDGLTTTAAAAVAHTPLFDDSSH